MVYQHILHVVYRLQDTRGEWITNRTNTQTIYLVIPYFRLNKISCLHFSNSCGKKYFSVFEIERVKNTRWTIAQMITDELLSEISELIWCTSYDFKDITGWNRIKTHDFILFPFFIFCSILIVSVWNFLPLSLKHIWSKSYHFQDMNCNIKPKGGKTNYNFFINFCPICMWFSTHIRGRSCWMQYFNMYIWIW